MTAFSGNGIAASVLRNSLLMNSRTVKAESGSCQSAKRTTPSAPRPWRPGSRCSAASAPVLKPGLPSAGLFEGGAQTIGPLSLRPLSRLRAYRPLPELLEGRLQAAPSRGRAACSSRSRSARSRRSSASASRAAVSAARASNPLRRTDRSIPRWPSRAAPRSHVRQAPRP